jgi:hypothetical protein
VVPEGPSGTIRFTGRARIVLAELDSDLVIEWKDIENHRLVSSLEIWQSADEILKLKVL